MARRWYGEVTNRLEENRMFCDKIEVGTGMTEFLWSDRRPYEVIEVRDQKHVTVRRMDHKHVGDGSMDNSWELISNPEHPSQDLVRIGDVWYWTETITAEDLDAIQGKDMEGIHDMELLRLSINGWDLDKIRAKGRQTRRQKANVSFGICEYYYDYEF